MSPTPAPITTTERAAARQVRTIVAVRSCDTGIQGPENLILALAQALRSHHVRYVIVNLWDGVPAQVALHEEALRRGLESYVVATAASLDPALLPRLTVLLRRLKPDIIHCHDFKSDLTVLVANPLVRSTLISSFYGRLSMTSLLLKLEDRIRLLAFRCFDQVLANSQAQKQELLGWYVPQRLIALLPSFVDTQAIQPLGQPEALRARATLGIAPDRPVLTTVARLSQNKGHRYMLEALAAVRERFPDVLYLVPGEGDMAWHGDGGCRGELERQAAALGLGEQVRFLGYYPELHTILAATDILVSPSLREGMQVSLLEAMAAGKPIIATAIGGTPDAVLHGVTGLLVPPADPLALAEAAVALLSDRARMAQMGAQGRCRAEAEFDLQVQATRMLRICEEVVCRV